jgi:ribosomal protein S18 acetylase RimI-like enzyme
MQDLTPLEVRPATAADARGIADVHVRAWQRAYRGLIPDTVLDLLTIDSRQRTWDGYLAETSGPTTLVAERRGSIAGFCSVAMPSRDDDASSRTAEIAALYVDPELWRTGIGAALMAAALEQLRTHGGCDDVTLWVLAGNDAAIAFYERQGFTPDGIRATGQTAGQDELRMRARL